jgi:mercuric ion binding protein
MKKPTIQLLMLSGLLATSLLHSALAESTRYVMRVDGLACPFCAYGIEKKFKAIEGTRNIDVDLDKGLVIVDLSDGRQFGEDEMKQLFADSGFTFRGMKTETHE